ncbi:MAG: hypothetical protein SFV55_03750 [Haliscomenobacter sp.]|uniref:hypothetical protein n=1 Tax=Haliscomenobacter sp. TaxID=2717303 RepID=UPI0029A02302|nr:hypothetical protein [Haliscomenobacter sp.]MDX2067514.1 hypothetical protein [Haliscomenobacter sp.]
MKKILFVALLLLLMQSCITSLYPLYTNETLVQKKELLATWKDKEGMYWKFSKVDDSKMYELRCRSGNYHAIYATGMVKIGAHYFLDVQLSKEAVSDEEEARVKKEEDNNKKKGINLFNNKDNVAHLSHNIPGHNFYKLVFKGEKIYVYPFNDEYMEELFKQRKIRIKHEKVEDSFTVLTASSNELQAFLKKYGGDPQLFKDDEPKVLSKYVKK